MTMDQQLLDELYGANTQEGSDEMIKEAQAELIEAVADEAGINLNELDDSELDKFAEYVLTPEGSEQHLDPNLATADAMGRQMAHSYADEQIKIASQLQGDDMYDYDNVLLEKAAEWEFFKEAAEKEKFVDKKRSLRDIGGSIRRGAGRASGLYDIQRARQLSSAARDFEGTMTPAQLKKLRKGFEGSEAGMKRMLSGTRSGGRTMGPIVGSGKDAMQARAAARKAYMRGGAKATALAAGAGGLGYLAMREKKSSYDPSVAWIEDLEGVEFAKLAEFRAAEILAANGVDPETFEEIQPEHIKVANFPDPEDAVDYNSAEEIQDYNEILDEAALDILEELGLL